MCVCVRMYVCLCVCMYACMYACVCMYVHIHVLICMSICICMCCLSTTRAHLPDTNDSSTPSAAPTHIHQTPTRTAGVADGRAADAAHLPNKSKAQTQHKVVGIPPNPLTQRPAPCWRGRGRALPQGPCIQPTSLARPVLPVCIHVYMHMHMLSKHDQGLWRRALTHLACPAGDARVLVLAPGNVRVSWCARVW